MSKDLEKQNQAIQTEEEIQIEPIQSTFNFQKLRFTLAGILAGIILIGMIAAHHCEVGQELRNSKLSKRDNGSPEFSTTTYSGEDGSPTATSTFVYTTRPIIKYN